MIHRFFIQFIDVCSLLCQFIRHNNICYVKSSVRNHTNHSKKIIYIIAILSLCISLKAYAQEPSLNNTSVTVTDDNNGKEETIQVTGQQQEQVDKGTFQQAAKVKHSLAFDVLGRELTKREKEAYGDNLSKHDLKNILAGEQRLAIVRALITVGEESSTKQVLNIYIVSELKTYSELVEFFTGLKEKYGSVKVGIESEYVYNITDNDQAFKKAASRAYETVFGIPEDKQENKEQIATFLTQSKATTYSRMVQALLQTLTPDLKKQLLFNALDQIGRPDLKTNDNFVNKLMEQEFTYEHLMELFKELQGSAPAQAVKEKASKN